MAHSKSVKNNLKWKARFRKSKEWTDFRANMRKKQKVDPITGQKLTRRANLHHMRLTDEESVYTDISNEDNFLFVSYETHRCLHYFFGVPGRLYNWRRRVLNLIKILKRMEQCNKEKYQ